MNTYPIVDYYTLLRLPAGDSLPISRTFVELMTGAFEDLTKGKSLWLAHQQYEIRADCPDARAD